MDEIPLEEEEPVGPPAFPPVLEMTDPFFSAPRNGPPAPTPRALGPGGRSTRTRLHMTSGDPDISPPDPADRPVLAAPPPSPPPAPVAAVAEVAPVAPGAPVAPVAPGQGLPVATGAAPPEIMDQPVEPEPPGDDPVALARALARAAVACAGPPQPAPQRAEPALSEPALSEPPPAAESAPEEPQRPLSRVEALSRRAVRPRSAEDVIQRAKQVAAQQEQVAQERRRQSRQDRNVTPAARRPPLVHKVQRLLDNKLRGLGPLDVNNCIAVADREVLRALWRAHRARFGALGLLSQVVGAAAVLDALDFVPDGMLVAAHVLTDASDYLVWLDMREGTPLAAFANARAYFVGQQTGA